MAEVNDDSVIENYSNNIILADIIKEVEQTPQEQWNELLQVVRQFRQSSKIQSSSAEAWDTVINQIHNDNPQQKAARQQALSELLESWEEEGDEQEQKETLEFIQQALNKDRLSNRPLFP